jgi:hypothetical protein
LEGVFCLKQADEYHFTDAAGRTVALPARPYMALRIARAD